KNARSKIRISKTKHLTAMKPILRKVDSNAEHSFSVKENIFPFLYNYWHYHPEVELTYIRKSSGTRLAGDSIERFTDGDLIILGANLPHMWRNDDIYFEQNSNQNIESIAIHFKEDFWGKGFLEIPEHRHIRQKSSLKWIAMDSDRKSTR